MPKSLKKDMLKEIQAARALLEDLENLGLGSVYAQIGETSEGKVDIACNEPDLEVNSLETLETCVSDCQKCSLAKERNKVVFGVGNPAADIVFVGEAPGRDEDLHGEPFVGEAGKLLDRILLAMGMDRKKVYICNIIKCRPPRNRDPRPEEIETCEPYLVQQLEFIRPRIIVALGKFATQSLMKTDAPISRLRGKWHSYQNVPLMPTYHPAYLLRNSATKRDVWEDMKLVLQRSRQEA